VTVKLILPASERQLDDALSKFEKPIVKAVAYLGLLAKAHEGKQSPVTVIHQALTSLLPSLSDQAVVDQIQSTLDAQWRPDSCLEVQELFERHEIGLLREDEEFFLEGIEREWGPDFTKKVLDHRNPLKHQLVLSKNSEVWFDDTSWRILEEFRAGNDESMSVQAFAGTGKTHLAKIAISHLDPHSTLVLANRNAQLEGMVQRLEADQCVQMNFGNLAWQMYRKAFVRGKDPLKGRHNATVNCTDAEIAQTLRFFDVGPLNKTAVARLARRAMNAFCVSADDQLTQKHLPSVKGNLSSVDREYLVTCAQTIWQEMFTPEYPDLRLPVRGFHLLKFLSMTKETIPEPFTHIVIDEAHELFPSARKILDRSPQAVLSLGDRYQRFEGHEPEASTAVRQRNMTLVHRAGEDIEGVINPLLARHEEKPEVAVQGTRSRRTEIAPYGRAFIPDEPTTILVGTDIVLFEWFQRLASEGAPFTMLSGAMPGFKRYMSSMIDLYHRGIRPNHPLLFRFGTWQQLEETLHWHPSFKKIRTLLSKGYDVHDFDRSFNQMLSVKTPKIRLGRIEDAKNLEFESVLIAPDVTYSAERGKETSEVLSKIYTGVSRAQSKIWLPESTLAWLQ